MTYLGLFLTDKCLVWKWLRRRSFEWFTDVKIGENDSFFYSLLSLYTMSAFKPYVVKV